MHRFQEGIPKKTRKITKRETWMENLASRKVERLEGSIKFLCKFVVTKCFFVAFRGQFWMSDGQTRFILCGRGLVKKWSWQKAGEVSWRREWWKLWETQQTQPRFGYAPNPRPIFRWTFLLLVNFFSRNYFITTHFRSMIDPVSLTLTHSLAHRTHCS